MKKLDNLQVWGNDFLYKETWTIKPAQYGDDVWWYCVDIKDGNGEIKLFAYLHCVIEHIDMLTNI